MTELDRAALPDGRDRPNLPLGRRLKVGVLCSHRAPGLVQLLHRDVKRGIDYEIVCCISSSDTFEEEVRVERRGVPCIPHSIRHFSLAGGTGLRDLDARVAYDRATLELMMPFNPDVLLLDGYQLLLTEPVLDAFDGRIINIHHSDLSQRDEHGHAKYPGLRAVRDALLAGETETRASAHIVTPLPDDGPVMLRTWSFPVPPVAQWALEHNAFDVLRAVAWAHQEWMLREAWAPLAMRTIELAALALPRPGVPLDLAHVGRWILFPNGTLTPDGAMVAV